MNTCLNCGTPLQGKYCSNCGQASDTHRISGHFLWHDIQHGLLHVDKGILFTAKELFTRPGRAIREFMEGKRVRHFKPVSLVIVLAGVFGFLSHMFHINLLSNNFSVSGSGEQYIQVKETIDKMSEWLSTHYAIVSLLTIPIFAVGTFVAFRKSGYNFIEHIVLHTFLSGQRLMLHIATFPILFVFHETEHVRTTARVIDIVGYCLLAWAILQFFTQYGRMGRSWRLVLSFLVSFGIQFLIMVGIFKYLTADVI